MEELMAILNERLLSGGPTGTPNGLLLEAAELGELDRVTACLRAGVPPSCADASGQTPLHKSAFMGHVAVAAALIEADRSCVHTADAQRNTPLHAAAFAGHDAVVSLLCGAGADVTCTDRAGHTPLHRACLEGHVPIAATLLQHGASSKAAGAEGNTALHLIALGAVDDPRLPELLLAYGAKPDAANRCLRMALHSTPARPSHQTHVPQVRPIGARSLSVLRADVARGPPAACYRAAGRLEAEGGVGEGAEMLAQVFVTTAACTESTKCE